MTHLFLILVEAPPRGGPHTCETGRGMVSDDSGARDGGAAPALSLSLLRLKCFVRRETAYLQRPHPGIRGAPPRAQTAKRMAHARARAEPLFSPGGASKRAGIISKVLSSPQKKKGRTAAPTPLSKQKTRHGISKCRSPHCLTAQNEFGCLGQIGLGRQERSSRPGVFFSRGG